MNNMSQKWNRLHAQEEVNVKLYQKDHNAQVNRRVSELCIPIHVMNQALKTRWDFKY